MFKPPPRRLFRILHEDNASHAARAKKSRRRLTRSAALFDHNDAPSYKSSDADASRLEIAQTPHGLAPLNELGSL